MIIQPTRRGIITGIASLIAAPALVRAESLMPVRAWAPLEAPVVLVTTPPPPFDLGYEAYQRALLQHIASVIGYGEVYSNYLEGLRLP